jgi:hypothetical protein
MEQGITWIVVLLIIGLVFWALFRENSRMKRRTVEEYERDVAQARQSLMQAGMLELDKFAGNEREKRAAVEYLKDEKEGMTRTGSKGDDANRTKGDE